jgi:hypothetical protein
VSSPLLPLHDANETRGVCLFCAGGWRRLAEEQKLQAERAARREQEEAEAEERLGEVVVASAATGAKLYAGDDPAAAAFRFAEKEGHLGRGHDPISLVSMVEDLGVVLAAQKPGYKPKPGTALRTAGAHARRAKESAKDGEYDAAAADLLRALARRGLEEDVVHKLMRCGGRCVLCGGRSD